MSAREDRLAELAEELLAVDALDDLDVEAVAARFDLEVGDVERSLRAVRALRLSLDEDAPRNAAPSRRPAISEDFELGAELGRGGMGVVYRAQQKSLGRAVAVKVLRPHAFDAAVARFRAEARSLARLRHPHIVAIHGVGETDDGLVYYTMDLVEGRTLAAELAAAGGALTPSRAVKITRQVVSAIAHAHAQGIVHRDLKPQNILIDAAGDAFVVDFGLARDASAGPFTMTGELLGTPAYMSPEQARGDQAQIGEASDVWAIGALLYEMLTGRGPFSGRPLHETIRAILEEVPVAPRRLDKRVPAALEAVAMMALRKRPDQRYATAAALSEDLERFVEGVPVLARRSGPMDRIVASMVQHRAAWIASAATIAIATAFVLAVIVPGVRRAAALDSARAMLDAGAPQASVAVIEELGESAPPPYLRERSDVEIVGPANALHARALLDRAGELLETEDKAQAGELGRRAFALLGGQRSVHALRFETQRLAWDYLRASLFQEIDVDAAVLAEGFDRELWRAASESPHRGERELAWLLAARCAATPALFADPGHERTQFLIELHRWWGRQSPIRFAFAPAPAHWRASSIADWWSPEAEDALADLVEDETAPRSVRALACRSWTVWTGFAMRDFLFDPAVAETRLAAVLELGLVERWRSWQELPRAEALSKRVEALAELAATDHEARSVLGQMLGAGPRSQLGTEGHGLVLDPGRWLRDRLSASAPVEFGFAIAEAAGATEFDRLHWRLLAFLELPIGARVPMALPEDGDVRWVDAWNRAAGAQPLRRYVASFAVMRIDELELVPEIVERGSMPIAFGEEVAFEVGAELPYRSHDPSRTAASWRSFGADRRIGSMRVRYGMPDEARGAPRFRLSLELRDDEPWLQYRHEWLGAIPGIFGGAVGTTQGAALMVGRCERYDESLRRHAYVLLAIRLDELGADVESVESWQRAFFEAAQTPLGRDHLMALWMPLPELAADLERWAREGEAANNGCYSPVVWAAAWLAGASGDVGERPLPLDTFWHTCLARVALHAPRSEGRRHALAELASRGAQLGRVQLSSASLTELEAGTIDDGESLATVRSLVEGWQGDELWRRRSVWVRAWLAALCYLLGLAFAARPRSWSKHSRRRDTGWVAMVVSWTAAAFLVHSRFVLDGVAVLPMWAALAAWAAAFALPVGLRATPWTRNLVVLAVGGVALWEWLAFTWPTFRPPPTGWVTVPYVAIVVLLIARMRCAANR